MTSPESAIMYGNFVQQCVDFLIIAVCVFAAVKFINKASVLGKKKEAEEKEKEAETPALSTEAELLAEIRDLLADKKDKSLPE